MNVECLSVAINQSMRTCVHFIHAELLMQQILGGSGGGGGSGKTLSTEGKSRMWSGGGRSDHKEREAVRQCFLFSNHLIITSR